MHSRHTYNNGVFIFLLLAIACVAGCIQVEQQHTNLPLPSHHVGKGFQNPYLASSSRGFFKYIKMRYFSEEQFADYQTGAHTIPTVKPDLKRLYQPGSRPQVTWVGHATMLIQYRGMSILTDPMFSDRASPVKFSGPERVNPPALSIEELPPIDLVVISHNHYDHLDSKSVKRLGGIPLWLVPLGLKKWFIDNGIPGDRVIERDWWDSHRLGDITVTATPAQHWSARSLWDRNKSLWASWMIQINDFTVWYSGDTGYNPYQFKEIGERFPRVDLGLISIGAYAPRWFMKDVHINPEEAVQIHQDIQATRSVGIQWGTFPLTAEPVDEPPVRLHRALSEKNIDQDEFFTMKIGETKMIAPGRY